MIIRETKLCSAHHAFTSNGSQLKLDYAEETTRAILPKKYNNTYFSIYQYNISVYLLISKKHNLSLKNKLGQEFLTQLRKLKINKEEESLIKPEEEELIAEKSICIKHLRVSVSLCQLPLGKAF